MKGLSTLVLESRSAFRKCPRRRQGHVGGASMASSGAKGEARTAVDQVHWRALERPGRRGRVGAEPAVAGERLRIVGAAPDGPRLVECLDGTIAELMGAHGLPPLPPYIERFATPTADDRERYQTVYARPPGSVAAPTAGLHFTHALLDRLRARGVELHEVTLHVGPGTFRPIKTATVEDHRLPPERVSIPQAGADAVNRAPVED